MRGLRLCCRAGGGRLVNVDTRLVNVEVLDTHFRKSWGPEVLDTHFLRAPEVLDGSLGEEVLDGGSLGHPLPAGVHAGA